MPAFTQSQKAIEIAIGVWSTLNSKKKQECTIEYHGTRIIVQWCVEHQVFEFVFFAHSVPLGIGEVASEYELARCIDSVMCAVQMMNNLIDYQAAHETWPVTDYLYLDN